MPQNKFAAARYRLIDQLLNKHQFVKTSYIVEKCRSKLGFEVTQRTIQMDMNHMKYDTFLEIFAPIAYCSRNKAYYYEDSGSAPESAQISSEELRILENAYKLVCNEFDSADVVVLQKMIQRIKKKIAK